MTPRMASRATITGPRKWRRRPSTPPPTAASRSASPSAWPGGRSKGRRRAMTDRIASFEEAIAFALTLPDTILSTSYGKPAVKVASNGRAFLYTGHEDQTSFGIAIDLDTVE